MSRVPPIYLALMLEIERRRAALRFPMERFSELAGLPDRYYPKALYANEPSGRVAQWSVQRMVDTLWPDCTIDVVIRGKPGNALSAESLKQKLLQLRAPESPKIQRELMRKLGDAGRAAQITTQSRGERSRNARKAARAR